MVAGLDLGFVPGSNGLPTAEMIRSAGSGGLDVLYLLGADEFDMGGLADTFVIYQGTHGDSGAQRADVILPGAAYTEKSATYANTEGRVQVTQRCVFPPGDAKEDWTILRALSAQVGTTLPYDTLGALRSAMLKAVPALARRDEPEAGRGIADALSALSARSGDLGSEPFVASIADFYLTNLIARASAVMAEMSALKAAAGASRGLSAAE